MKHLVVLLSTCFLMSCTKDPVGNNSTGLKEETTLNVAYGTEAEQKMDVYLPTGRSVDSTKVMVLIHGGAWNGGDKSEFNAAIASLKTKFPAYAFININYRLATTAATVFPTQENDVRAAINYIVSKSADYKINASKLVLLGASAGAHLAMLQAYKNNTPKVKAVVDFFGPTDMAALYNAYSGLTQFGIQVLLSGTPVNNPTGYQQSSPINYVSAQSPPTIILHGGKDDIVPISQSINLKTKLQSFGVVNVMYTYPNEGHGWFGPTLEDSFDKIQAFLLSNVQ